MHVERCPGAWAVVSPRHLWAPLFVRNVPLEGRSPTRHQSRTWLPDPAILRAPARLGWTTSPPRPSWRRRRQSWQQQRTWRPGSAAYAGRCWPKATFTRWAVEPTERCGGGACGQWGGGQQPQPADSDAAISACMPAPSPSITTGSVLHSTLSFALVGRVCGGAAAGAALVLAVRRGGEPGRHAGEAAVSDGAPAEPLLPLRLLLCCSPGSCTAARAWQSYASLCCTETELQASSTAAHCRCRERARFLSDLEADGWVLEALVRAACYAPCYKQAWVQVQSHEASFAGSQPGLSTIPCSWMMVLPACETPAPSRRTSGD